MLSALRNFFTAQTDELVFAHAFENGCPQSCPRCCLFPVDNLTPRAVEICDRKIFAKLTLGSSTIKVISTPLSPTFSEVFVAEYQM
jgi:hypothetical protein